MSPPRLPLLALPLCLIASPTLAQQIEVEEFVLPNGMEFLLLPRHEQPNTITAGWVAKVGSVNERPGITGISHFFEHMMFTKRCSPLAFVVFKTIMVPQNGPTVAPRCFHTAVQYSPLYASHCTNL